ncbi:MAG: ribosome maturation factor RimM [Cytophagales bacterium]|nr:ribosome maturation factor RimM [Cytophagales bacterium]
MDVDQCYQLGHVIKAHGIKGEVGILLDVDFPEHYKHLESVFIEIDQKLVPFFIRSIAIRKDKAVVKFEDVKDIEAATALKGCLLYLPLDQLPRLGDNQFYYHEIIGFEVIDDVHGKLGPVNTVYSLPNQDLLAVIYHQKEVLIPVKDEIIKHLNRKTREIHVKLPEGLLEVYLEEFNSDDED